MGADLFLIGLVITNPINTSIINYLCAFYVSDLLVQSQQWKHQNYV